MIAYAYGNVGTGEPDVPRERPSSAYAWGNVGTGEPDVPRERLSSAYVWANPIPRDPVLVGPGSIAPLLASDWQLFAGAPKQWGAVYEPDIW